MASSIRLYVEQSLASGGSVFLADDQVHYLRNVMRLKAGDAVRVFNGEDGEWEAELESVEKRQAQIQLQQQTKQQSGEPDLWLLFAPIKKAPIDLIAEKATELGVSALWPVITQHTNAARVNLDRMRSNAVEAAEQCGRLTVPEVFDPMSLDVVLQDWDSNRRLLLFDETGAGRPVFDVLSLETRPKMDAILIGPEGGFSSSELDQLRKLPFVTSVTMGERILRAETASIAALACWQALCGDWRNGARDTPEQKA